MSKEDIDNYFNRNFPLLQAKAQDIHSNVGKRQGDYNDLIQDAYLEIIQKADRIDSEKTILAFFCKYVSQHIKWFDSKFNRDLVHCTRRTNVLKENGITEPVADVLGIDAGMMVKLGWEMWYQKAQGCIEKYKAESLLNRRFADIYFEENGETKKIAERIGITANNVRNMTKKMMNDMRRVDTRKTNFLVVGLGPSSASVKGKFVPATVIGVNDAGRVLPLDLHVVVDPLRMFEPSRARLIKNTKSQCLYTHLPEQLVQTNSSKRETLEFRAERGWYVPDHRMPKSYHSTFVAAALAVREGAKTIAFAGMDILGHPDFANDRPRMMGIHKHLKQFCEWCADNKVTIYSLGDGGGILDRMPNVITATYEEWVEIIESQLSHELN